MNGEERRLNIVNILRTSPSPVPGVALANELNVSRQIIVQDIALLRANRQDIISTNRGYVLKVYSSSFSRRVFKVIHNDSEVEEELNLIVDHGGKVEDVFVYHKIYGVIRGEMNIKSRLDVKKYMKKLLEGKSSLLKNVTSGYHYHTIIAENEEILDCIQQELEQMGFLAKLQDYEPVDFWSKK